MCTSSSSATVAVGVALCPAHSTEHTARSSRRSLMRRNGRNRKKCSMLLSELGAVFEPRYLCALIYHLSRVPHTLDTLQNRWSLYIYTRTHLCVCRCACAIASQIEFPQLKRLRAATVRANKRHRDCAGNASGENGAAAHKSDSLWRFVSQLRQHKRSSNNAQPSCFDCPRCTPLSAARKSS